MVAKESDQVEIPSDIEEDKVILETKKAGMGLSRKLEPFAVVYIDAVEYYHLSIPEKYKVSRILGEINRYYYSKNKEMILFTPGRICTSSPELGVPSSFAEISGFSAIFERECFAEMRAFVRRF